MDCKQCGAPLSVEQGRDFFHCQYCGSYEFPDPDQDGVALLDEVSPYVCPFCQQPLVSAVVHEVRILSCSHCRGNLIRQSKMLPILSKAQPSSSINTKSHDQQDKTELTRTAICPSCRKVMADYPYGGPGNIVIQGCEHCEWIWLDFGELSRIVQAYWELYGDAQDEPGARKKGIEF